MAWVVDETVVLSFGTSGKSLASGETGILPLVAEAVTAGTVLATGVSTKEGSSTGCDVRLIRVVGGANAAGNSGLTFPPHISSEASSQSFYVEPGSGGAIAIENLPDGLYDIVFAASRNVGFGDGGRVTQVTLEVGTASDTVETFSAENPASGSVTPHVTFSNVAPASGIIQVGYVATANFAYMGAIAFTFKGAGTNTYSYTGSGGLAAFGSSAVSKAKSSVGAGGAVFAGAAAVSRSRVPVISGGLTAGGSSAVTRTKVYQSGGGLVAGGSAATSLTGPSIYSYTGSGGMAAAGVAAISRVKVFVSSGGGVFGGSAIHSGGVPVVSSPGRTMRIEPEARTLSVEADIRILRIAA
ncbi:MAG: hypothetical protein V4493_02845 [Pseudomonadota bacterium]